MGNLVVVGNGPFRSMTMRDMSADIREEMKGACLVLKRWKWHSPIIGGGALWSWASGNTCRDVDIFVKSSRWTRWRASRAYGSSHEDKFQQKRYSTYSGRDIIEGTPVARYQTILPIECAAPVDFNLTPWKGGKNTDHFDYAHVRVAFGYRIACAYGAEYYERGELVPFDNSGGCSNARPEEVVLGKVQSNLWGKPYAGDALRRTLDNLRRIYKDCDYEYPSP
jgi:hypothetical protein